MAVGTFLSQNPKLAVRGGFFPRGNPEINSVPGQGNLTQSGISGVCPIRPIHTIDCIDKLDIAYIL